MVDISASMVKELRSRTGATFLDCKNTLVETDGDYDKAIDILRVKGLARADKKMGRVANEGIIASYIHAGGRIGVMTEVNCETDFVAKTAEFQEFAREVSMQIAATNPYYVSRDQVPPEVVAKEKEILKAQVIESGKPEDIAEKIVEGKLDKFYEESCLIEQPYIREPKTKIEDLLKALIAKVGENVVISRFTRYQLGETPES